MRVIATTVSACPACDHPVDETDRVLHVDEVPAVGTRLWPTGDEARRAPRGTIDLVLCRYCGLVYNRAFDPTLVTYEPGYENSQLFSPAFRRYASTRETAGCDVVNRVVDVNPRKVDRFLPVSGHRVGAPESLQAEPPATVVVANAVYEPEVRDRLAALELAPEVVSL